MGPFEFIALFAPEYRKALCGNEVHPFLLAVYDTWFHIYPLGSTLDEVELDWAARKQKQVRHLKLKSWQH